MKIKTDTNSLRKLHEKCDSEEVKRLYRFFLEEKDLKLSWKNKIKYYLPLFYLPPDIGCFYYEEWELVEEEDKNKAKLLRAYYWDILSFEKQITPCLTKYNHVFEFTGYESACIMNTAKYYDVELKTY